MFNIFQNFFEMDEMKFVQYFSNFLRWMKCIHTQFCSYNWRYKWQYQRRLLLIFADFMKKSRISSSTCLLGPRSITCGKTLCDGYGMSSTLYGRLLRYSTQIASSVIHIDRKRMRWWMEAVSLSNDVFTWRKHQETFSLFLNKMDP